MNTIHLHTVAHRAHTRPTTTHTMISRLHSVLSDHPSPTKATGDNNHKEERRRIKKIDCHLVPTNNAIKMKMEDEISITIYNKFMTAVLITIPTVGRAQSAAEGLYFLHFLAFDFST
jgi:hypothetical protein